MHILSILHSKRRNAWSTFHGKLARKREPAPRPENIHDCLRWNGSHAQASLEFRPSLVTRRHRWIVHRRRESERKASSFFSPTYMVTTGVQKCPICPFPRATDPASLVSSHPEYHAPLITSDGQKATPLLLYDENSPRGRLKIRVLYSSPLCETDVVYVCTCESYRSFQRKVFA